jgi:hypothetical protein
MIWKKDQNHVLEYEIFGFHGVENFWYGCVVGWWCCVVLKVVTNILQECIAAIVYSEDGGNMSF